MDVKDNVLAQTLLAELANEEANFWQAEEQFKEVRAKFQVASRKYAAVRDMVTDQLGHSPYKVERTDWPLAGRKLGNKLGKHRFTHMKPGDAVIALLKETEEPLTLDEIVERLSDGGFRAARIFRREINAALMKTAGVEKTEDGKYKYKEEEEEDIPFVGED